jgi:hypothetical protein
MNDSPAALQSLTFTLTNYSSQFSHFSFTCKALWPVQIQRYFGIIKQSRHLVGLLARGNSPMQRVYTHTGQHNTDKRTRSCLERDSNQRLQYSRDQNHALRSELTVQGDHGQLQVFLQSRVQMRIQVLTVASMKTTVWVVAPCSLVYRRFGGGRCLHNQGDK